MKYTLLFIEASFVGILLLLVSKMFNMQKNHHIILTGIIVHLLCEFSGINKYYCRKGRACVI